MAPLIANYHKDSACKNRAATIASGLSEPDKHGKVRGLSELNNREEKPAPKPRSKSREEKEAEEPYMKQESRKFHQQVASNLESLVNNAERYVGVASRGKSLEYGSKGRDSSAGSKGSKKESYIQKLIGLNRTASNSSGSKYPFAVPPWQKLLKGDSVSS